MPQRQSGQPSGLLQICPNDGPPFADLCAAYGAAASSLNVRCHTVFLGPPRPDAGQHQRISYLNLKDLTHHRAAAERLHQCNPFPNPKLILCHRYRSYRVARAAGLAQTRTVALAHEFGMLGRWQRRLDRWLSARELTYAGISPPVVAELEQTVDNALLLPNVIDWARLDNELLDRDMARSELGIAADTFCIGVVGRLHPKKRPHLAIDAMAALQQQTQQAELLFIGDGSLHDALRERADGMPVRFVGFKTNARRYFRGLDALLMTSSRAEAFGMVALEALTAGLPVVAPDVPGIRSVLGELGFYADADATPESLVQSLRRAMKLVDRAELTAWQAAARTRVRKEFSISAAANRLQPLLQSNTQDPSHVR